MKKYHIKPDDKFNRLTTIKLDHIGKHYRSYFLFECDCGRQKVILGSSVISGNTKSCGCLSRENHKKRAAIAMKTKQGAKTAIYLGYKRHAKDRNINFNISKDDLISLSQKNCFYCNSKPSNLKKTKNDKEGFLYSGVDRIDNTEGYSINNCVSCCRICNYAKSNMSLEQFRKWAIQLGKNAMAATWG